ncbi:MAG: acyl-CoA dehydrogenase [Sandaracinaceae bacterium]|nr:acyl-CoA dehydrogenase [Sandaracinaceae bacterium]
MANPLVDDRLVDLVLWEVVEAERLTALERFRDHSRETFELYVAACRRVAREVLFPSYRELDEAGARLVEGRVVLHPKMRELYAQLRELGVISATRPEAMGGAALPVTIATMAHVYLQAGNLAPAAMCGLTTGAAHLVEAFGDEALRETFARPMYDGRWAGTMALTEPQAGSSLADLTTRATPAGDGTYRIDGAKIFISGGDQDVTENVVHLTLARIDGAPAGTRGISLFAVPRLRPEGGALVDNDVEVSGLIHKIGWRALPSLALAYGSRGDCRGWLVGEPHRGLAQMFQMMNEARLMIGVQGAATASVAYHESLAYARERTQGRALGEADPASPPVPLIAHADVRRMLLRQKAIVDGSLCLAAVTARFADEAAHGDARAQLLLDLLTPVTKSFPAERGYEANTLALQIHGGYGYSSEYLPEAWLRDQKLNSIHEGTTGIQGLDLLGRKAVAKGGAALFAFSAAVREDLEKSALDVRGVRAALDRIGALTAALGARGLAGDLEGMLAHSADYLEACSILVIAWMHVKLTNATPADIPFASGLRQSARYWLATEVPRVEHLAALCEANERSYLDMRDDWFG